MNKCLKNDLFLNVQFIVLEQIFLKKFSSMMALSNLYKNKTEVKKKESSNWERVEGIKYWDQKHKFKSLTATRESKKVPEFTILAMLWRDDRWRLEKSKKLEEQVACPVLGTVWRYCLTHGRRQGITPDVSPDVHMQAMTNMSSYSMANMFTHACRPCQNRRVGDEKVI